MKQNKDIRTFNSKGERHGYQELYNNNKSFIRCTYKNNLVMGYFEWHLGEQTRFHIR